MLTKLRIKNFKCFQDTGELDLRPLTFLVGPNSSGKSSILQFLYMLKQTVESEENFVTLVTNGMGAYSEFVYKGENERNLEFELFFKIRYDNKLMAFKIETSFFYDKETTEIKFKKIELISDDVQINFKITEDGGPSYEVKISNKGITHNDTAMVYKFYRYSFPGLLMNRDFEGFLENIDNFRKVVSVFFSILSHIGPLRDFPHRIYVTSGQVPKDVGSRGEKAIDILWISNLKDDLKEIEIKSKTVNWFREFGFANDIELLDISNRNYYSVIVTDPNTEHKVNLADVGFGASQTLPIIIESFYAPPHSTILIEQPEIHLHPKAQLTLGDLFVSAVNESPRTFIIETHSELILARVLRNIAEKKIKKEDVAIYYFYCTLKPTVAIFERKSRVPGFVAAIAMI